MALNQLVPSGADAERLAELLADARAIPSAAFTRAKCATRSIVDLTIVPTQRQPMQLPADTVSLITATEHHLVGYQRLDRH